MLWTELFTPRIHMLKLYYTKGSVFGNRAFEEVTKVK